MKKPIVFIILLLIVIGAYFTFSTEKKSKNDQKSKKTDIISDFNLKTIVNSFHQYEQIVSGEICEIVPVEIKFNIDGKLINGDILLQEGEHFNKNQLLYRLDNKELFLSLADKKDELSATLQSILPQLGTSFSNETEKWTGFKNEILPVKILPELPPLISPELRVFLIDKGFMQAYVKVKMLEKEMEKYYFLAPFDGIFLRPTVLEGESVSADSTVAYIAKDEEKTVEIKIKKNLVAQYKHAKNVELFASNNKKIGSGKFCRYSRGQSKNSCSIFYTITTSAKTVVTPKDPIKIKTKLTTVEVCAEIPSKLIKNGSVEVLVNNKNIAKSVKVIATNGYNSYVIGLENGDQLILN